MTDQFEQLFGSPLFLAVALGQSTDTPEGSWLQVRDRDWRLIEIADCGAKLCGSIVKTQSVFNYTQTHKVKQRKKNLEGCRILSDFIPSDHLSWTGQVLDIEDGNVYSSVITLRGKRTLQIDTFKGSDIIKIDFWTRVEKAILIDGVA